MSLAVADFVFPTARFSMSADGQKVADFDVQTFAQPDGSRCPVVATSEDGDAWTRSVYRISKDFIFATREIGADGSTESYQGSGAGEGCVALPVAVEREANSVGDKGSCSYQPALGEREQGVFVYTNTVIVEGDKLLWLEDYEENYGGLRRYLRLHCFQRGKGMIWYVDHEWPGGPQVVTRDQ